MAEDRRARGHLLSTDTIEEGSSEVTSEAPEKTPNTHPCQWHRTTAALALLGLAALIILVVVGLGAAAGPAGSAVASDDMDGVELVGDQQRAVAAAISGDLAMARSSGHVSNLGGVHGVQERTLQDWTVKDLNKQQKKEYANIMKSFNREADLADGDYGKAGTGQPDLFGRIVGVPAYTIKKGGQKCGSSIAVSVGSVCCNSNMGLICAPNSTCCGQMLCCAMGLTCGAGQKSGAGTPVVLKQPQCGPGAMVP